MILDYGRVKASPILNRETSAMGVSVKGHRQVLNLTQCLYIKGIPEARPQPIAQEVIQPVIAPVPVAAPVIVEQPVVQAPPVYETRERSASFL
jgi:hypothetical protein